MITKAEIQSIKALADKRGRVEQGAFIAEGEKLVAELLSSHLAVRKVYTTKPLFSDAEVITDKEMERISQLKSSNSTLAVVEIPHYNLTEAKPDKNLVLALDRVQNPGNLGTIIRLADWFGITDIVCSVDSADCFNPKVIQATMGAIIRVRVHYTNLPQWLESQRDRGVNIYGTFLDGMNIYDRELDCGAQAPAVIVIGNEANGISEQVAAMVSDRLYIPPYPQDSPGSESLNAAIATAITVAEFRRRK
jgi:TrmH family RNA methyltransferase